MIANVFSANGTDPCGIGVACSIDGTAGNFAKQSYGDGIGIITTAMSIKTGVTAGAKTLKLREYEIFGSSNTYTVEYLEWIAIAIPE
jgi:hypothetical protein